MRAARRTSSSNARVSRYLRAWGRPSCFEAGQKERALSPSIKVNAGQASVMEPARSYSFAEIFRDHARYLWRVLLGLGVRSGDVDDVLQEVFLIVHRRLPEF